MPITREEIENIIIDPKERETVAIILNSDFHLFIKYVHFAINDSEFTFKPFHLTIIKKLQDIEFGNNKKRNLCLCLPVGSGKSLLVEYFIAWSFCRSINKAFLYTSHSNTNIMKLSREVKEMFEHEFIVSLYGINLKQDERSKINWSFENAMNRTGLVAKPTGAGLTGADAGHRGIEGFSGACIVDDPMDIEKRNSEIALEDVISFYSNKLATRRRTPTTPFIIIMQRISLKDLVAYIKENELEDYELVEVPALEENGESFWPEMFPKEELEKIRTLNPEKFYSQYQQNPIAGGNAIYKREWFKYYQELPELKQVIQSWDTAFKKGQDNDYSVCTTWGIAKTQFGDKYYLIDVWRDKLEYPQLKAKFIELQKKYNPFSILVEDKASGQCYDKNTEVLTKEGWKLFKDLNNYDYIATRNLHTKEFEWQKPTHIIQEDYKGEMYHFKGRSYDLMVTPNHRMLVNTLPKKMGGHPRLKRKKKDCIITAEELVKFGREKTKTPTGSNWQGDHIEDIELVNSDFKEGKAGYEARTIKLLGDDYVKFMAMYLSEGWTQTTPSKRRYTVHIGQYKKGEHYEEFLDIMKKLGKVQLRRDKEMYICNRKLYEYVRTYGTYCDNKYIPDEIMNSSREQLQLFWDYYMKGDGHITHKGTQSITTTSYKLAGQLQEIAVKLGFSASIRPVSRKVIPFRIGNNKTLTDPKNLKPCYVVGFRKSKGQKYNLHQRVNYDDKIYCASVPNGIMYVRRNGFPVWSGNSIVQDLKQAGNNRLKPVKVDTDKETRTHAITALFEGGSVYFPKDNNFMPQVLDELLQFPNGAHDDINDSITQFLNWANKPRQELIMIGGSGMRKVG